MFSYIFNVKFLAILSYKIIQKKKKKKGLLDVVR